MMQKTDAHQHFWKFDAVRDSWITDEMEVIRKDFLPHHLIPELQAANIDGCVAVQADQSERETAFLLSLAKENDFIKGIVGWTDLSAENVEERLSFYASEKKIKGFRHIMQGEANKALMLTPRFMNGIAKLKQFDFTYDILISRDQLQYIPEFVEQHPYQKFVIDHLAKPSIKNGDSEEWKKQMHLIAQLPNVWCKVSGMVTEADWNAWQLLQLAPYLDVVWEAFGANRLLFGSDWPVCLIASSYQRWVSVMEEYTAPFSNDEKEKFWGKNAMDVYHLIS